MIKAIWNGKTIAETDKAIEIEGNMYFPPESIHKEYFHKSDTHTICPWKGKANYYTLEVDKKTNEDAAWYYPEPKSEAKEIKNYVAFWNGVKIEK